MGASVSDVGFRLGFPTVKAAVAGVLQVPTNGAGLVVPTVAIASPVIDMTAAAAYFFAMDSFPGYYPVLVYMLFLATNRAGGALTSGPTISAGNNAATFTNVVNATSFNAQFATLTTSPSAVRLATGPAAPATGTLLDLTNRLKVNVTVPCVGAGGYALSGKFILIAALQTLL
jgi:hypothetical protein